MLACFLSALPAHAWIFPEHRQLGASALQQLSAEERASFERLWAAARHDYRAPLCTAPASSSAAAEGCIDFAAWPAIAADHSCSPEQLLQHTLSSAFVIEVMRIGDELTADLAATTSRTDHKNVWIDSNLKMEAVDDEYLTRAGANNAHFLLPRSGDDLSAFVASSTRAGAPLNAMGLYIGYHLAALQLATTLQLLPTAPEHAARARQVLALEAYALHFLQDLFSAGHIAGTWGDTASRKGTHDYYCEHGLAATSWSGATLVLFGDAHMRAADVARTSRAAADSLSQLVAAATAGTRVASDAEQRAARALLTLDSCAALAQPQALASDAATTADLERVLRATPRPSYGAGSVALPRFRAEFGPFVGLTAGGSFNLVFGGYGHGGTRPVGQLAISGRVGYGLEEVLGTVNSGTMYLQAGVVMQTPQHDACASSNCEFMFYGSELLPRVPARVGLDLGLRVPFWLVPLDLLVLGPVLALASPSTLTRVAMVAANGGVIPWQRPLASAIGTFEFVLGRSFGVTLFGVVGGRTLGWAPRTLSGGTTAFQTLFRSAQLTFPVLEFTPLRTFAQVLTASLRLELAYAIDVPFDLEYRLQGDVPGPAWEPAHLILLRLSVDGRAYW